MTFKEMVDAVGSREILIIAGHVLTSRVPEFSAPCLRCGRSPLSSEILLRETWLIDIGKIRLLLLTAKDHGSCYELVGIGDEAVQLNAMGSNKPMIVAFLNDLDCALRDINKMKNDPKNDGNGI